MCQIRSPNEMLNTNIHSFWHTFEWVWLLRCSQEHGITSEALANGWNLSHTPRNKSPSPCMTWNQLWWPPEPEIGRSSSKIS